MRFFIEGPFDTDHADLDRAGLARVARAQGHHVTELVPEPALEPGAPRLPDFESVGFEWGVLVGDTPSPERYAAILAEAAAKKVVHSVPYVLVSEDVEVIVRATATTVELLAKGARVASHVRDDTPGKYTTDPAHMPKAHRDHAEWDPPRPVMPTASVPAASSGTSTATNGCTGHALPMTAPTRTSPPGVLLINAPAPTSSHGTTR